MRLIPLAVALAAFAFPSVTIAADDHVLPNKCVSPTEFEASIRDSDPAMKIEAFSQKDAHTLGQVITNVHGGDIHIKGDSAEKIYFTLHDQPLVGIAVYDGTCLRYMNFLTPSVWNGLSDIIFGPEA